MSSFNENAIIQDSLITINKDEDRLRKWKSEFKLDHAQFMRWYVKKQEWERFYDGDQLSQEEKLNLQARGQPEVVMNHIKPRVDGVVGDFLGRRIMMRAFDRGSQDFDKAKYITEALRYIENRNRFDEFETIVANNLFITGCGWYKASLEFDFLEAEIKVTHVSHNDVIIDRRCRRRDMKDAKRLWETIWIEAEDLIERYPDFEDDILSALATEEDQQQTLAQNAPIKSYADDNYNHAENYVDDKGQGFDVFSDKNRRRLRLTNVWERVQKRIEFAFHPNIPESIVELSKFTDGELRDFKKLYPDAQYFVRTKWELNSGLFITNKILEYKTNVRPHDSEGKFPFARALGNIDHVTSIPYGLVRQYVDPQKEYNKRRSKLLHKTNVNQIHAEEGAFAAERIEDIRREASRPDGIIIYKAGKKMEIKDAGPAQAEIYLLQLSQNEIEAAGISRESIGTENTDLSGKAIALRQVEGDKMLRRYYASMRSARRDIFEIVLEEMQQYWTSEKLIKITDDPKAGMIVLNQRVTDPYTGKTVIVNDLRLGKYDIKIDEDTETMNQRQENFMALTQLAPIIMKTGQPFPIELLIAASNMPGKDDLIMAIAAEKQRQMEIAQANAMAAAGAAYNKGQNVTPTGTGG